MIIGTRSSKLALWQANHIKAELQQHYPGLDVKLEIITTTGDKILDVPLAKIGGKGLFTKELENEMLAGNIDLAVHSLKDMPTQLPEGLVLAAVGKREDPRDALVSNSYKSFADLPQGAKVGTSSLRRKAQLLNARPDLAIYDLRGNVDTRLKKLVDENLDAIVLAVAGLKRLGYEDRITEILSQDVCLPAVGQGALAIEARAGDEEVLSLLSSVHDDDSFIQAVAERAFLHEVEGGCQVPVGVYAVCAESTLKVRAVIASVDGLQVIRQDITGKKSEAEALGIALAQKMLADGGKELMAQIGCH